MVDIVFELLDTMATNSFNPEIFNQVNVEGLIRNVEEEAMRLLKQVVENNQTILELQKQLAIAVRINAERKRREENREYVRRGYEERW